MSRILTALPLLVVLCFLIWLFRRLHYNEQSRINLTDLVVNRYGKLDIAACAFCLMFILNLWVVVLSMLRNAAPAEGVQSLLTLFNTTFGAPLIGRVIVAAAKSSGEAPQEGA